jgi:arylsulfatase A-like enzyme
MERGWIGHTITLHKELIHVPLIMKLPGAPSGVLESSVGLIDVMPTILQHLGISIPEDLDGQPLDLARPGRIADHPIFSETSNPQPGAGDLRPLIRLKSIVFGGRKLIYDRLLGTRRIYDLATDPQERNDLSAQSDELNQKLDALLEEWIDYVKAKEKPGPSKSDRELFTPEQIRRLKSLGYL